MVNRLLRYDAFGKEEGDSHWTASWKNDDEPSVKESWTANSRTNWLSTTISMVSPAESFTFSKPTSLPSGVHLTPPFGAHDTTLSTTYTTSPSAQPDQITSTRPTSSPTTTPSEHDGPEWADKLREGNGIKYAAAGIVPAVLLAIIGLVVYFRLRKRKRQREIAATQAKIQEMKARNPPVVAAHYDTTPPSPPPSAHPQYAVQPRQPLPSASPTSPPPVILGPIAPASNGAYFTGIDTSDVAPVTDRTGLGNPFADGNSVNDEPPPPYRPRSVAVPSRETSLRAPEAAHSQTNLVGNASPSLRSPFADPEDDDAVSDMSGPTVRREHDAASTVSDLSYQEDDVVNRRTA